MSPKTSGTPDLSTPREAGLAAGFLRAGVWEVSSQVLGVGNRQRPAMQEHTGGTDIEEALGRARSLGE